MRGLGDRIFWSGCRSKSGFGFQCRSLFVCNQLFIIPLHAARRARAATPPLPGQRWWGFSRYPISSTTDCCQPKLGLLRSKAPTKEKSKGRTKKEKRKKNKSSPPKADERQRKEEEKVHSQGGPWLSVFPGLSARGAVVGHPML